MMSGPGTAMASRLKDSTKPGSSNGTAIPSKWTLVWSDEFDGPAIDRSNQGFEIGYVRNKEFQYYTDRQDNAAVENGRFYSPGRASTPVDVFSA
jgi:hypothetical protein